MPPVAESQNPQNVGGRPRTRVGGVRNAIASWRQEKALTQVALAELCGVKPGHLASWETGYNLPTWDELVALAGALGVTPAHLYSDAMIREIRLGAEVA